MAAPFRSYDIRGLFPEELDEALAFDAGRAASRLFGWQKVCVAHDMRPSSPALAEALTAGLTRQGVDVEFLGMTSTDMMYLAVLAHGRDAGFMITASHNPAGYNGIKVVRERALPVGLDSGLAEIEAEIARLRSAPASNAAIRGPLRFCSFWDEYLEILLKQVPPAAMPPFAVTADSGNGMGGRVLMQAAPALPLKIHHLYADPDGTFPHHDANPMEAKNRRELEAAVVQTGSDLGVGFDGDADRAFFVDGKGVFRPADHVLALLVQRVLRAHPGSAIVYDVRCSRHVTETIERCGGTGYMGRVGHAHAKPFMMKLGAVLGGELSGHTYFPLLGGVVDSGLLTFLTVLAELNHRQVSLEDALRFDSTWIASGEINLSVENPAAVLERLLKNHANEGTISQIDGLRIDAPRYWFSVRASNTEPLLRVNVEADSADLLQQKTNQLLEEIAA